MDNKKLRARHIRWIVLWTILGIFFLLTLHGQYNRDTTPLTNSEQSSQAFQGIEKQIEVVSQHLREIPGRLKENSKQVQHDVQDILSGEFFNRRKKE